MYAKVAQNDVAFLVGSVGGAYSHVRELLGSGESATYEAILATPAADEAPFCE